MKRRNLEDEIDLTQESVRDLTGWCIQIALHQCFGVGRQRLIRLNQREYELTMESFSIVMTPDASGRPQGEKARALRAAALPEGVPKEFRVPALRAPRTRREQQLKLAGDRSATMAWQLYAKACMEVLGFGPDRLNRLYAEARANYEQMNEEGQDDQWLDGHGQAVVGRDGREKLQLGAQQRHGPVRPTVQCHPERGRRPGSGSAGQAGPDGKE